MQVSAESVRFFRSAAMLRRWLAANHAKASELWVGFYRKGSGKGGITYSEALDEALCYGWIDGLRKKLDDERFMQRFSPRKPRSVWSAVNIERVRKLTESGRMAQPGAAIFAARDPARSGIYSFERESAEFPADLKKRFRDVPDAWNFFQSQPPYYRKMATWWVISARKDETRARRLQQLIDDSAHGRRLAPLTPARKSGL